MLAQVMQMTAAGLVVRYFATFSAPALVPKDVSDFATSFSLSNSVTQRSYMVHLCVAGLFAYLNVVCTYKYCTIHNQYSGWDIWSGGTWSPIEICGAPYAFSSPCDSFFLYVYRQLTPGTPSLWHSIPSVFHGSLARLIRRSKARKTLSLWASWISLASRTFRSEFCLLQGGLVLEMSVHIGRNFGWFVSCLG